MFIRGNLNHNLRKRRCFIGANTNSKRWFYQLARSTLICYCCGGNGLVSNNVVLVEGSLSSSSPIPSVAAFHPAPSFSQRRMFGVRSVDGFRNVRRTTDINTNRCWGARAPSSFSSFRKEKRRRRKIRLSISSNTILEPTSIQFTVIETAMMNTMTTSSSPDGNNGSLPKKVAGLG